MIAFHLGEAHVSVTIGRDRPVSPRNFPRTGLSLLVEREGERQQEETGESFEPLIHCRIRGIGNARTRNPTFRAPLRSQYSTPPARGPSVRPSLPRLYIIASFHI